MVIRGRAVCETNHDAEGARRVRIALWRSDSIGPPTRGFSAGLVHRPVEAEVFERFLDCGDLHKGFARVYCDQCGHDYLLAYSCKTRYFCPSCHQKRMFAYGECLEDNVLAPVPHRQYFFALPKLIRPFFRYRRPYLGELCRLVAALLKAGFKVMPPLPEAALREALPHNQVAACEQRRLR